MRNLHGWLNIKADNTAAQKTLAAMSSYGPETTPYHSLLRPGSLLATDAMGSLAEADSLIVAVTGRPQCTGGDAQASAAQQVLNLWRKYGRDALQHIQGSFGLAILDTAAHTALLAIDRVGVHSMAFAVADNALAFSNRADAVSTHPAIGRRISMQSLFNYFYFYDVPAPGTIYQGVEKLLPGQYAWFENGTLTRDFYWHLHYRDDPRNDFEAMAARFQGVLRASVGRACGTDQVAAFLSGGTDSSTVAGILTEIQGHPARTYSIGFSADGFDEMEFARLAGKRFGLDMREYYLTPDDVLAAIPIIAQHYDEPFANESAVPTYFCAKLAQADGYRAILAGDGGDEIFGGNTRYAKQKVFEAYGVLPTWLRTGLIEPLAGLPGLAHLPPTRKLQSYIRQANIPLPERTEAYNYLYRQPLAAMFMPDFLAQIDSGAPLIGLKDVYKRTDSASFINRMMHLDMKFTIADNDLRKVNGMTEAAGIEVRYPLLDDAMVAFSGEVPPDWKVKGQYLRWFFKNSLKGFLPDEIINKSKHGFGLPFGVWARDHAPLRERMEDRLSDFKRRGWLQPAYIDMVREQHRTTHATYFGKMLWVIVMLEEWMALRSE